MRTVLLGVFGSVLLIVGSIGGVGGLGLLITDSCTPTYRLTLQPADAVSDPPEQTVSYGQLTDLQQIAVDASLENRPRKSFRNREPLAELTETVIEKDDAHYVASLITSECRTPYDDFAIAGFSSAVIGVLLLGFTIIAHRHA